MISPLCTDEELIRACKFVESHQLRTMGERLQRRITQLDTVRKLATSDRAEHDPAGLLAEIEAEAQRR